MDNNIYLGIDVGTQGIRGIAWQSGEIVARAQVALVTRTPQSGWAMQELAHIWSGFRFVVTNLAGQLGDRCHLIRGLGIDATASILLVTPCGEPLTDVLLWMDVRAKDYVETIGGLMGRPESAELPWSKALWLYEHHGALFRGNRLVEVADWLTWRLTGEWTRSESSAILKWHAQLPNYLPEWANLFPEIADALPKRVVRVAEPVGVIQRAVAEELNLSDNPIVIPGSLIDAYAGAIGSGALEDGSMALILGSSTCELFHGRGFTATAGLWGPFHDIYHVGLDVLEAGQPSTGSVVRWVQRNFAPGCTLEELDLRASKVNPGSLGLKVFPAFQGVRSPWPDASSRGQIDGLSLGHDVSHMLRAVYEGTAIDIRRVMDVLEPGTVRRIIASGGGVKSQLWTQIIADVCGLPLELADNDAVTRGAAMLAAKADGTINNLADISFQWPTITPSDNNGLYQKLYSEYLEVFPTKRPRIVSKFLEANSFPPVTPYGNDSSGSMGGRRH
ncbi:MAG: FGGY-family carbohydrate kinase [Firmicutes bacterium]|nr:FGGY-family carbohydrate kinase [Bacillota bacterium]